MGIEKLKNLIQKIFLAAGFTEAGAVKGFEVSPMLVWPLLSGAFLSRFFGVPPKILTKLGIPCGQGSLAQSPLSALGALFESINNEMRYRVAGAWHALISADPHIVIPGEDLHRLNVFTALTVAGLPWDELFYLLESGTEYVIPTTGKIRRLITPTGGGGQPRLVDRWAHLAAVRCLHGGAGLRYKRALLPESDSHISLPHVRMILSTMDDPNRASSDFAICVPPVAIAQAVGLRLRLARHARIEPNSSEPAQLLLAMSHNMSDPARRLTLHLLAAARSRPMRGVDETQADPFKHLEDPWLQAALLGAATTTMSAPNRKDLKQRLSNAAEEVLIQTDLGPFRKVLAPTLVRHCRRATDFPTGRSSALNEERDGDAPPAAQPPDHTSSGDTLPGNTPPPPTLPDGQRNHTPEVAGACPHFDGSMSPSARDHVQATSVNAVKQTDGRLFKKKDLRIYLGTVLGQVTVGWLRVAVSFLRGWRTVVHLITSIHTHKIEIKQQIDHEMVEPAPTEEAVDSQGGCISRNPWEVAEDRTPYALSNGACRPLDPVELNQIDHVRLNYPFAVRWPRELVVLLTSYLPPGETTPLSATTVIETLANADERITPGHVYALLRWVDQCPVVLLAAKHHHMLEAINSIPILAGWMRSKVTKGVLADWQTFDCVDPTRLFIGYLWRHNAPSAWRTEEAARAFAEWWVATNLPHRAGPGTDPALEAAQYLLSALGPLIGASRWEWAQFALRDAASNQGRARFDSFWRALPLELKRIYRDPINDRSEGDRFPAERRNGAGEADVPSH